MRAETDRGRRVLIASLSLIALAVLGGCATAPRPVHDEPVRLLVDQRSALITCNVERSSEIPGLLIRRFLPADDAENFLGRTSVIHILLNTQRSGGFTLLAEGSYPRGFTNMAFGGDEQWQKKREPLVWWQHRREPLQIAVLPGGYLLISNGGIERSFARLFGGTPYRLPERVMSQMRSAAVSLYAPHSGTMLEELAAGSGARADFEEVRTFTAALTTRGDEFTVHGDFTIGNADTADAFALGFRLLLLSHARSVGPERVRQIIQEVKVSSADGRVQFSGIPVTPGQVEELIAAVHPLPKPEVAGSKDGEQP